MRMPSIVSAERSRWVRTASAAVRRVSLQLMPPTGAATQARRRSGASTIRPSRIWIVRSARVGDVGSWVISTIVRPVACSSLEQAEHVGGRRRVEVAGRLVGEDHRRLGHQRPGDGDPLLLATRQLARRWSARSARPTCSSAASARSRRSAGSHAGVHQRQLDVAPRRQVGEQVELLEHEADEAVADVGELVLVEGCDVVAGEAEDSRRRHVEAPEDVHQRRLARAGRPDDGDELVLVDAQRDVAQRRDLEVAGGVDLADVDQLDDRRGR